MCFDHDSRPPIPPIAGGALDFVGKAGFGLSLAAFYAIAGAGALLAMRRSG